MKKKIPVYLIMILGLMACKNNENSKTLDAKQYAESTAKGNSCSCLEGYNGDPTFFDNDFVADIAGSSTVTIEKGGSRKNIIYTAMWNESDVNAFLSFENIETFSELKESYPYVFKDGKTKTLIDYVKKTYRNQSDEETARIAATLNEQYEKQNKNNTLAKESETAKNTLQNKVLDMEQNAYSEVENLGDYAVFNIKSQRLYVVCGNVFFELGGQVGPWGKQDREKGKALAIKGARKIVNKCS